MDTQKKCSACGGSMQQGFAAVMLDGTATPLFWVGGELERERLTRGAKLEGRERVPIVALCCDQCGVIQWSASRE